jgi:uncharacterized protein
VPEIAPTLPFHTFLWKIASRCNLNCTYCYIYNSQDTSWRQQPPFMSEAVARQTASRILEHCRAHGKRDVCVTFHGGEPLLGGVDHLEMLITVVREELTDRGLEVSLGMQSNGLLFTPEIGELMLAARMTVGISTDGPPVLNDRFRIDHAGRGSGQVLEDKIRLITSERYRPIFAGFLCVINLDVDPLTIARYLLSADSPIASDWPAVDFMLPHNNHTHPPPGKADPASTPYADWLIPVFDYWFDEARRGNIRLFNAIVKTLLGAPSDVESFGLSPVDLVVVETDGTIEGVDTLKSTFQGAAALGFNVFADDFETIARHANVRRRQIGMDALCATCRACPIVHVCGGGYLPHRYSAENGFDNPSVYCSDLMKLIHHVATKVVGELIEEAPSSWYALR